MHRHCAHGLLALLFGALGCGDAGPGALDDAGEESGGPAEVLPVPQLLAAPEVVARGGQLYALIDLPLSQVDLLLGERLLDGDRQPLRVDFPGVIVTLPEDLPLGSDTLVIRRRDDPRSETAQAIEVVERRFVDVAEDVGLDTPHEVAGSPAECAQSHTGQAFGDFDGDGAPDLYVGHVGASGRLHRNLGDVDGDGLPDFEDVTEAVGLLGVDSVAMATFIDLEGDGDADLFIGRRGENRVFRNLLSESGEAIFEDVTEALGLGQHSQRTMGVAFGDYDGDDDLDLYVVNHAWCFPQPGFEVDAHDHLYRNDDGVFVDRTADLPSSILDRVGFSAAWVDLERDGDPDLVVINDDVGGKIGDPNAVWRNDGPHDISNRWNFTEVGVQSGVGIARVNGMGLALGDVNHDGFVDMAFSNIGENYLLLNTGDGTFVDVSLAAGIMRGQLPWDRESITWATHLFDHDNDGDLDLYLSGGRIKGTSLIPDALFDNEGDGTFRDQTWAWGMADPGHGKGSALVDLDRDGAWDLVTSVWGAAPRVYHNRVPASERGHWLDVELQGRGGNREAIGAIVELQTATGPQTCFHSGRPSLGGGGESTCHFGLGAQTEVTSLRIIWPDGSISEPTPPAVDRRVEFVQEG